MLAVSNLKRAQSPANLVCAANHFFVKNLDFGNFGITRTLVQQGFAKRGSEKGSVIHVEIPTNYPYSAIHPKPLPQRDPRYDFESIR